MNGLTAMAEGLQPQLGLIAGFLLALLLFFLAMRSYFRRQQIQQVTKMSKEFRQQQVLWEDQRKALEENAALLQAELKEARARLDEVRREHNRQSIEWQENQNQLSDRTKQLYQLCKKREQEKIELEKTLAISSADWKREKDQFERANLRLRNELSSRGDSVKLGLEAEQRQSELRQQLADAQAETLALQRQIADQSRWSEQVQQTLEEELNRLSEELSRLRQEDADNVKTLAR